MGAGGGVLLLQPCISYIIRPCNSSLYLVSKMSPPSLQVTSLGSCVKFLLILVLPSCGEKNVHCLVRCPLFMQKDKSV